MTWIQLRLDTNAQTADRLAELLSDAGAASVTLKDGADEPLYEPPLGTTPLWSHTTVTGLFPAGTAVEAVVVELRTALAGAPLSAEVSTVEDQDWTRLWMDGYRPMRFGDRLWICPGWCPPPRPDAANVLLDPGLAFGTGTHATTALCLQWLDGLVLSGSTVVDYGCGSGVLGIAALKLGATRVWAVDTDPQARLATRDNAARNGVDAGIAALVPESLPALRADVLVANILANPLWGLAPRLSALLRSGGRMALSGILPEQAEALQGRYAQWLNMGTPQQQEGWVLLQGVRRSSQDS